jgi:hypothetical protein
MRSLFCFLGLVLLAACDRGESRAVEAVKRELKDPFSAVFKDVEKCGPNGELFRGEVNSKNAYGAFVGFERFYTNGYSTTIGDGGDSFLLTLQCHAEGQGKTADAALKSALAEREKIDRQVDAEMATLDRSVAATVDRAAAELAAERAIAEAGYESDEEVSLARPDGYGDTIVSAPPTSPIDRATDELLAAIAAGDKRRICSAVETAAQITEAEGVSPIAIARQAKEQYCEKG